MFKLVSLEDTVRIPPEKFGHPLRDVAVEQLRLKYAATVDEALGYVLTVTDINVEPVGRIMPGDGATYHKVTFSLLTFYPMLHEVIEGEVVEAQDFGVFIRIGPVDALLHVSQVMDDFIVYDERQGTLMGKQTHRILRKGDIVRVRIAAVSLARGGTAGKIGATARQPFLGKLDWIKEDLAKAAARVAEVEGQEAA